MAVDDLINAVNNDVDREKRRGSDLVLSVTSAFDSNPDDEAYKKKLEQSTGIPSLLMDDKVKKDAELQQFLSQPVLQDLPSHAPRTADFLSNAENAKLAHDDIENLSRVEKVFRSIKNFTFNDIPNLATTYGARIGANMEQSVGGMLRSISESPENSIYSPDAVRTIGGVTIDPRAISAKGQAIGREGQAISAEVSAEKPIKSYPGKIMTGIVESIGQMIPGIGVGVATGSPTLAVGSMGAMQYGQTYTEAREKGLGQQEAAASATIQGGTEVVTELIPFMKLTKFFKPGKVTTKLAEYYLAEIPGEHIATAVQNTTGKYFDDPNDSPEERKQKAINYFFSQAHTQDQIDTFFTTLGQSLILGGTSAAIHRVGGKEETNRRVNNLTDSADNARLTVENLKQLGEAVTQSKLHQRMPEKLQELLSGIEGDVKNAYIPSDRWQIFWQEKGLDPEKVANEILSQPERYYEAVSTGGDVVIPFEEFTTKLAGSEYYQELIHDVRLHQGDMTAREAEEWQGKSEEEINKLIEQAKGEEGTPSDVKVYEDVLGQKTGTGTERGTAEREATLMQSVFRTLGQRTGIDPYELYQRYNLRITRGDNAEAQAAQLSQEIPPVEYGLPEEFRYGLPRKTIFKRRMPTEGKAGKGWDAERGMSINAAEALDNGEVTLSQLSKQLKLPKDTIKAVLGEGVPHHVGTKTELFYPPIDSWDEITQVAIELARKTEGQNLSLPEQRKLAAQIFNEKFPGYIKEEAPVLPGASEGRFQEALPSRGKAEGQPTPVYSENGVTDKKISEDENKSIEKNILFQAPAELFKETGWYGSPETLAHGASYAYVRDNRLRQAGFDVETHIEDHAGEDGRLVISSAISKGGKPLMVVHRILEGNELRLDYVQNLSGEKTGVLRPLYSIEKEIAERYGLKVVSTLVNPNTERLFKEIFGGEVANQKGETAFTRPENAPPFVGAQYAESVYTPHSERVEFNGRDQIAYYQLKDKYLHGTEAGRAMAESGAGSTERPGTETPPIRGTGSGKAENPFGLLYQDKRGFIRFGNGSFEIALLEKADLSTFLHEVGHFYLEVLNDLTKEENAPQQIKDDVSTLRAWLGAEEGKPLTTDQHEQFARAFEAYLMEGKAPSVELRSTFERFKAWLTRVYRDLKNLRVNLTDEVRQVFDRLVATDEEIKRAEAEQELAPMFATAEKAGMSQAAFEAYKKDAAEAGQKRRESLQKKLMAELTREQKAWWKEERQKMWTEVEAEAKQNPVYQAFQLLTTGETFDGEKNPVKLSREALVEMYGEEFVKKLPRAFYRLYAKEDGLHPDVLAEMFGFSSGDEMIRKMIEAPKMKAWVAAETDIRMRQKYGDMLNDGSIAEEALKAVHNDETGQVLRAELAAIRRKQREVNPVLRAIEGERRAARKDMEASIPPVSAFREAARKLIASKAIKDLEPHVYSRAEAKAAKEAFESAGKNDFAKAGEAKQRQILNHYLFSEASKAREEADNVAEFMAKFEKPSYRQRLGLAGESYLNAMDELLEQYEFRKVSNKKIGRRSNLLKWYDEQVAEGYEPPIPQEVLDDARQINYRQLTIDELRGVKDTAANIYHFATFKNKLLKALKKREVQEAVDEAVLSIEENAKGRKKEKLETHLPTDDATRLIGSFFASHRKFANIIREMDGWKDGGVMWELFVRPMNEAGNLESTMNEQATEKLGELFGIYGKATFKLYQKTFIPEINDSMTHMGRLMVALNWGNEGNRQRLVDGNKWNSSQVQAILDTLDENDWKFVQGVWDFIDSYWPEIEAKEKRVYGVAPEKIEPMPIMTKFGEVKGGYFPIKYDERKSPKAYADRASDVAEKMKRGWYSQNTTLRGFTKERKKEVVLPVRLDFGAIFEHVGEVIHDLSHHEMLIDNNRLMKNPELQHAIISHYGDEAYKQLQATVTDVAAGSIPAINAFEKSMNWARQGATVAGLGFNVMTSLAQPLGLTQSMVRIGPKWVAKGISRWIRDAVSMENTAKWIFEKSPFMANRTKTINREINEISNRVRPGGFMTDIENSYFYLITKLQLVADIPTWLGEYEKAMEQEGDEKKAIALADQAVIDAQGSGHIKDLAQVQRGGPMLKLWTNFYSFFSTTYNLTVESMKRTDFKNPASVGRLAVDMLLLYTIPAILGEALKQAVTGGGDDDKDKWKKMAQVQASYAAGTMLGVREISGTIQGFRGYEGPAGARIFSETGKLAKQVQQGQADKAFWKALNNTAGILLHYPALQVQRTIEGMHALAEGRTHNPFALVVGPPKKH